VARPEALDDDSFDALAAELRRWFESWPEGSGRGPAESPFDALALRVYDFQLRHNPVYRRFAEARGRGAHRVSKWREIPPVPTRAFKELPLRSVPPGDVERVFRTSGTTAGRGRRGEHHVASLDLYRAASVPNLRAHLCPELEPGERRPLLSLLPSPRDVPDSSLSAMVGFAADAWGAAGSGWFVDAERGLRTTAFQEALDAAVSGGVPVLVAGTAFSYVHWLDAVDAGEGRAVRLPEGSSVLETGGFKGRSREVSRETLYGGIQEIVGVPLRRIVNEYGMTELLSQFYEPVLSEPARPAALADRFHRPPPWVRTRVLDPVTLEEVDDGEPGLLCHLDLANLGSVAAVLTEDEGVRAGDGFRVRGRVRGAEPRGCSLAMEEIERAAR